MKYFIIITLLASQVDVFSQGSKGYILEMSDGTLRGVPNGSVTNVMLNDADLTTYAGITPSANIQTFLGSATYAIGRNLLLPSKTGNTLKFLRVNAGETDFELVTIAGGGDMLASNNLSDLTNAATARGNIGLGNVTNESKATMFTNAVFTGTFTAPNSPTFINLTSAFSSTSTTLATVTGWSFAVTSGKTYRITVIADYQTAATTTGGQLGITLTTATGSVRGIARGTVANTAAASELAIPIRTTSGAGSILVTTAVTAINSPHYIGLDITFTCTGSGTFNIAWATEIAASASQLNANSSLIYQALN